MKFEEFLYLNNTKLNTYFENYSHKITNKVYENMKNYINCFDITYSNYNKRDLFNYYLYCTFENKDIDVYHQKFNNIIDLFKKNVLIDGVIITGKIFGLIELCRFFYNKYNLNKSIKIDKIYLFKNTKIIDYDIEIEYINSDLPRHDGLLRSEKISAYDESHYKDLSNFDYKNKNYIIIDSDLLFINNFDLNVLCDVYISPQNSHLLKINNEIKYWIGNNFCNKLKNNSKYKIIKDTFIHIGSGLSLYNQLNLIKNNNYNTLTEDKINKLKIFKNLIKNENLNNIVKYDDDFIKNCNILINNNNFV